MKLELTVNKNNFAEIESYLAVIALETITEDIEISSHFSCPTTYGYIREINLSSLYDIETALINLRAYKEALVRCKIYQDVLLDIIKAESTRQRAERFKAKVSDTYSSDTMNLTELDFYLKHFVIEN